MTPAAEALSLLRKYWGHEEFRPLQEAIILSAVSGKDTLALLPTGGGKSVCFQIPALMRGGLCLVISPLIALMRDQVDHLSEKNISAAALHSGLEQSEITALLDQAVAGDFSLLYVSPERLESRLFQDYLADLPVSLLVVDEAHCVSQWGYDFRPSYLRIAAIRNRLADVPLMALTASATRRVQEDIIHRLQMRSPQVFRQSFERKNLSYNCYICDSKMARFHALLKKLEGSALVYCSTRKQTKQLAEVLQLQGISATDYHAGMPPELRAQKQNDWIQNRVRVMVCTNAFGMGIDKPDVRTVIHYDSPDCLENYYQEAGRAGRDGKPATAILLYQAEDINNLLKLPATRFPPIPLLKQVYQSLADFLQVPVGMGEGRSFDFDLGLFAKNFQLDIRTAVNALKILEQEGHISFSESVFLPSRVQFLPERDRLEAFEQAYPAYSWLIRVLLRTYAGIWDLPVTVYEKQLARLCRSNEAAVRQQLEALQANGIIQYTPQSSTPQILYRLNRASASYLHIRQDAYLEKKKWYGERIKAMHQYILDKKNCRSKLLSAYFGETLQADCGQCDNCQNKRQQPLPRQEFTAILQAIEAGSKQGWHVQELADKLTHWHKDQVQAVLDFLISEDVLAIDEKGRLQMK
ncbi:MAG TPA: ATP-dependent DNA helicase RecQ [Sediminibacterium sp.]|nr:ATP-dependent DNA helicase RecQ [Sediminibacterium sp.]